MQKINCLQHTFVFIATDTSVIRMCSHAIHIFRVEFLLDEIYLSCMISAQTSSFSNTKDSATARQFEVTTICHTENMLGAPNALKIMPFKANCLLCKCQYLIINK